MMGGGRAALSLSIQLKRRNPQLSVLVAERSPHPPPEAAFKVGESTIEGAAHYFREVLGLEDYVESEHLVKPGLRFYFSQDGNRDVAGRFERKLAADAVELGVEFGDRCRVRDVEIGSPHHAITLVREDAEDDVRAR